MEPTSDRCRASIDGPKVGPHVVLWRRTCRNRTSDPSGLCHVHRDPAWYVGKPKGDAAAANREARA